jgi:hypothetical protein
MRFTQSDNVDVILSKLAALGITATTGPLGLELSQGATEMSLAKACSTLRQQNPTLFASDVRFDTISSREDFHGTAQEIARAKADWISAHSLESYEQLPRTRAEAELKSVPPSPTMNRSQWLALPRSERARLMVIFNPDLVGQIMARVK